MSRMAQTEGSTGGSPRLCTDAWADGCVRTGDRTVAGPMCSPPASGGVRPGRFVTTPPQPPHYPGFGAPPPQGPPVPPQYGYPPPQVPYGQQPPPGAGWGPAGPPSGGGKRPAAIVGVVVLAVVGGWLFSAWGNSPSSSSGYDTDVTADDKPAYEVTLPKTLEDGKFELVKDMSEQANSSAADLGPGDEGVMGAYGSKDRTQALLFTGVNSDRAGSSESETGGSLLNGMEQNPDVTVEVPRRQITPAGAGEALSCEVLSKSRGTQELTIKVCAWTDDGSSAAVVDDSPGAWAAAPSQVDLEAYADRVAAIRDEVREPSDRMNS